MTQDANQMSPFWRQFCLKVGISDVQILLFYLILASKPSSNSGSATKYLVTLGTSLELSPDETTGPQDS